MRTLRRVRRRKFDLHFGQQDFFAVVESPELFKVTAILSPANNYTVTKINICQKPTKFYSRQLAALLILGR